MTALITFWTDDWLIGSIGRARLQVILAFAWEDELGIPVRLVVPSQMVQSRYRSGTIRSLAPFPRCT